MKIRFMAGEMAQLHRISKQTLIYYDRIGLIRPREVDPDTGYRYYDMDQCEDLVVILFLKGLGMKLKEIKAYRSQSSTRARIRLLESQERTIRRKLDQIHRIQQRLASMVGSLKANLEIQPFETGIKWVGDRPLLSNEVPFPHDLYAMELCFKDMFRSARENYDADIHDFMVYVEEDSKGEELFKKVAVALPLAQPINDRANDILRAGYFAYIFHKGPYEALEDSRRKLGDFINASGHSMSGPYVERVLLSGLAVSHEKDYLLEIQIRVETAGA